MKYAKKERMDIARRVYDGELTIAAAAVRYDLNISSIKGYLRLYREANSLPPKVRQKRAGATTHAEKGKNPDLKESDLYAHKYCRTLGIKSKAKHYKYKKPGSPFKIYPNLLITEMQIDRPLQYVASGMTAFYGKGVYILFLELPNPVQYRELYAAKE